MTPIRSKLLARARNPGFGPDKIQSWQREIGRALLACSQYVREPNFTELHADDLEFLFDAYDRAFLDGLCRRAVAPGKIRFRLSEHMTRTAGSVTRPVRGKDAPDFEVAVSSFLLFDGFAADSLPTVAGVRCASRLEALQRVLEHEIVHLVECIATGDSNCGAKPFQEMARSLFSHCRFTHELLTRRARAAQAGIVVGTEVSFDFRGTLLTGRVNRVSKRATVLVPDPEGRRYTDGCRYAKYYVPLEDLRRE